MSYEQLRDQLERAGRRSVPAPREEFVDALLARIQMGDADLPRPVPLAARSASRRLRLTAVVGMAAALLIVVGAVATLQSAPSGENDVAAQLAGQTLPGGSSVEGDFLAGNPEDGTHPAVCTRGGRIATADGAYICQKGERLEVEVADGKIVSVRPEDGSTTSVSAETSALPRFELKLRAGRRRGKGPLGSFHRAERGSLCSASHLERYGGDQARGARVPCGPDQ